MVRKWAVKFILDRSMTSTNRKYGTGRDGTGRDGTMEVGLFLASPNLWINRNNTYTIINALHRFHLLCSGSESMVIATFGQAHAIASELG
jgi:hypothetical protein